MSSYPTPAVSGAIFNAERKILLTKRSGKVLCPHTWCLPGGHLDGGSDWVSSMRREMLEEVGISVRREKLYGMYSDPREQLMEVEGKIHHFVTAAFLVLEFQGEIRINEESEEWGWFSRDSLPDPLLVSEPTKIRDAFDFRGSVFLR